MERIKRNPGGWGVALGGAIGLLSVFFAWLSVTDSVTNVTAKAPAFRAVSGQTLGFLALLVMMCGLGLMASTGVGRFLWGLLALLSAGIILAAGLITIFSPETTAQQFATTQLISTLKITGVQESASAAIKAGFDSGDLTAKFALGAIVGTIGGALGVLGAIYGFRKKPNAA